MDESVTQLRRANLCWHKWAEISYVYNDYILLVPVLVFEQNLHLNIDRLLTKIQYSLSSSGRYGACRLPTRPDPRKLNSNEICTASLDLVHLFSNLQSMRGDSGNQSL